MAAWSLGVYTVCTDEHGSLRHLEITSKDKPDVWMSTFILELIALDFPIMSSKGLAKVIVC